MAGDAAEKPWLMNPPKELVKMFASGYTVGVEIAESSDGESLVGSIVVVSAEPHGAGAGDVDVTPDLLTPPSPATVSVVGELALL